ncbi:MAG: class IV adenylate cyclase [Patescibacteria group bacterium]
MREIEIKLKVKNKAELQRQLEEKGCFLSDPISQHDVNYSKGGIDEWKNAKEGDIMPRIRYQKDFAEFNVKQQRSGEMDNTEHETKVSDPKAIHKILLLLGYQPEIEVTKIRRKGKLGEYEICLDEVEQLGSYVELEKLTDDNADPQVVREELFRVAESLGLSRSDEETRGYDTQIYYLSH